jgi:hypothetical protein
VIAYFANLTNARIVLWCYFLWYLNTVAHHFDPSPSIWLNAVGVSAVIGVALVLSVGGGVGVSNLAQTFRLFAMPFCVSSFSSLIKGKGFMLVIPPSASELGIAIALCVGFVVSVLALRTRQGRHPA